MVLEAVIFDLGGTLVYRRKDSNELIRAGHQAMANYLVGEGFDVERDDIERVSNGIYDAYASFAEKSFIELDSHLLYSAILDQLGIIDHNEDLIKGTINSFYSPFVDDFHIFPDVKRVLSNLREKGLKIGLVTNNHSRVFHLRLLEKFDLRKFFDAIAVSSSVGIRKPNKRIFLHCLKMLGVNNKNTIFVGDSPLHDIQGAKNAGIRSIWVKRKEYEDFPTKPDWIVESIKQVPEIIAPLLSQL